MIIRHSESKDLEKISLLERTCFPPAEAATSESLKNRLDVFSDCFWLLEDNGRLISVIDGMLTDLKDLNDNMYADAGMHDPDGKWLMIFGVETDPEYQRQGFASAVMNHVISEMQSKGKAGIVLTCKEALIPFYSSFGYINEGVSQSDHGGALWYQMRLTF